MICPYPYESLPKVPGTLLQLLRRLRGHLGAPGEESLRNWATSCLGGADVRLQLTSLRRGLDFRRAALMTERPALSLSGPDDRRGLLVLDHQLVIALAGRLLDADLATGTSTDGELGLAAFALAGLVDRVQPALPWSLGPTAISAGEWDQADVLEAAIHLAGRTGRIFLLMERQCWSTLPAAERPGVQRRQHWLDALRLDLRAELARVVLGIAELRGLARGDTLVSPALPTSLEGAVLWLGGRRGGIQAIHSGGEVRLTSRYRRGRAIMNEDKDDVTAVADELDVEVVVEMGRVEIAAHELLGLASGDVLTLSRPLVSPLELRVGGRVVARGELVDVDGEAGVRISQTFE